MSESDRTNRARPAVPSDEDRRSAAEAAARAAGWVAGRGDSAFGHGPLSAFLERQATLSSTVRVLRAFVDGVLDGAREAERRREEERRRAIDADRAENPSPTLDAPPV